MRRARFARSTRLARSIKSRARKIDLEIIHAGVGPISENDMLLASASNAVVIGFNVKVENMAVTRGETRRRAGQTLLDHLRTDRSDQRSDGRACSIRSIAKRVIGHAEVKQVFQLSRGIVAGCLVTDGRIARTARARVLRRRQPVYDGGLVDPAPVPGRRERSALRPRVRHQAGRFQRISSGRHHRVLPARSRSRRNCSISGMVARTPGSYLKLRNGSLHSDRDDTFI